MIVNDELETMHCVFYDPRIRQHPLHIIKVERSEVEETIKKYKKLEKDFIARVEETLAKIIKF